MTYQVKLSRSALKALKKLERSGSFNPYSLNTVLHCFEYGETIPEKYKDHQLRGEFAHLRECHLEFNLLLVYKRNDDARIITVSDIGTHSELFGE